MELDFLINYIVKPEHINCILLIAGWFAGILSGDESFCGAKSTGVPVAE